jgi:hypothetical protein
VPTVKSSIADVPTGDTLCRNALQKEHRDNDAADMIDLQQMDAITRRTQDLIEVGREKGANAPTSG